MVRVKLQDPCKAVAETGWWLTLAAWRLQSFTLLHLFEHRPPQPDPYNPNP